MQLHGIETEAACPGLAEALGRQLPTIAGEGVVRRVIGNAHAGNADVARQRNRATDVAKLHLATIREIGGIVPGKLAAAIIHIHRPPRGGRGQFIRCEGICRATPFGGSPCPDERRLCRGVFRIHLLQRFRGDDAGNGIHVPVSAGIDPQLRAGSIRIQQETHITLLHIQGKELIFAVIRIGDLHGDNVAVGVRLKTVAGNRMPRAIIRGRQPQVGNLPADGQLVGVARRGDIPQRIRYIGGKLLRGRVRINIPIFGIVPPLGGVTPVLSKVPGREITGAHGCPLRLGNTTHIPLQSCGKVIAIVREAVIESHVDFQRLRTPGQHQVLLIVGETIGQLFCSAIKDAVVTLPILNDIGRGICPARVGVIL